MTPNTNPMAKAPSRCETPRAAPREPAEQSENGAEHHSKQKAEKPAKHCMGSSAGEGTVPRTDGPTRDFYRANHAPHHGIRILSRMVHCEAYRETSHDADGQSHGCAQRAARHRAQRRGRFHTMRQAGGRGAQCDQTVTKRVLILAQGTGFDERDEGRAF